MITPFHLFTCPARHFAGPRRSAHHTTPCRRRFNRPVNT